MLSIADLVEDFLPRRKPIGAIFTFVVVLYVLPLISVNLAEYLLNNANVHGSKLLLYLLGYSINIIYCLLHRNVVEDRIAEFKAALYISAGVYALVLAILTMLAPSQVQDVGTSQVAAVFVSFTMCRGLVEIFSIQKESKYQ
ncbi:MAG: hypothetical protein HGA59_06555 [Chlorobiaceae bacterium]|nr:hypothetical protein [Chlorobiaceae bacterium]NTV15830.1 hypothetical protein [Chlorobiaceae bacterium]